MAGISFSGLASGMDTEGMIQQLMAIERVPRNRIVVQQAAAKARQEALQGLNTKLTAVKSAADALGSIASWAPTQTVAVSDTTKADARVTGGAGPGTYRVTVSQLASADQRTYNWSSPAADDNMTLNGKALTVAAGSDLDTVVAAINADTGYGVFAVNANNRLVLAARTTGAASAISLTGANPTFQEDVALRKQGVDASYTLDGRSYTSANNIIDSGDPAGGFIPGVELTLKSVDTAGYNVTVSNPAPDKTAISNKVKAFVDAYNVAMDAMRTAVQEKRVPNASTESDARKGVLFADITVQNMIDKLRSTTSAFTAVTGDVTVDAMFEIGVSTGAGSGSGTFSTDAVNGKLTFDATAFSNAYDANPLAVQKLLGGVVGTTGFAQHWDTNLDPYSQAGGILTQRIDAAGSEITRLGDSLTRMDTRLAMKEESLRKMFTALEVALQKSRSQSADMLSQLGQLSSDD